MGVLIVTGDLGVQQLNLHLVHERAAVGVGEDGLVVDGVVVDELYVTHTGGPVDILQSPFDPGKERSTECILGLCCQPTGRCMVVVL